MAIIRKGCFQVNGVRINNTHSQHPASDWIEIYRLSTIISHIILWRTLWYPGTTVWQRKTITPLPRLMCDWAVYISASDSGPLSKTSL